MKELPDTPSLAAFKADAKRLLKDAENACPKALDFLLRHGFTAAAHGGCKSLKLSDCQHALAASYGYEYQALQHNDHLISKYIAYCYEHGYWSKPFSCDFNRGRFFLQFEALSDSLREDVPLAKAARKRGVDFANFHFSNLIFSRIAASLDVNAPPIFSDIEAPGALIEDSWLYDVDSLKGANLRDAKFYSVTVDPAIRPGAHCFQADFSYADLRGADFRRSYLRGSLFVGANLDGADFRNSTLSECDFAGAKGDYRVGKAKTSDWSVEHVGRFKIC